MNEDVPAYGLWPLVVINALIFIIFAFSFFKPHTRRDWRTFGTFSAFLVALFTEMYGFPLTIYVLAGWLGGRFPGLERLTHNSGHLWQALLGWEGDPHLSPIHLLSDGFIFAGFMLLAAAWKVLYAAQRTGTVAVSGPYGYMRHPQYVAFIAIMVGFLIQWPTLITLAMFPVLVTMYVRLARREERESLAAFGEEYARYAAATPAFIPRRPPLTPAPQH
jgi:protein-S-isoprenylcysteine O-methyltransferase Ste14